MELMQKNKNAVMVVFVLIVLVGVGLFLTKGKGASKSVKEANDNVLPDVEILPTVANTVKVKITSDSKKQEALLSIDGVPQGTSSIEYELSYDADIDGQKVPKGVIGTIEFDGKEPVKRQITLGTCSSGTCKYDKGIASIKASLKFTGSYGSQLFEGEFKI